MKAQFCPDCGSSLLNDGCCSNPSCTKHTPIKKPSIKPSQSTFSQLFLPASYKEKGTQIVPDCVRSDQDERPIKQYDIARLQTLIKGAKAEGRLQITNKRVLFRAVGNSIIGPTSLQYEFSIEEIAGIEIRKEARLNIFATFAMVFLSFIIYGIFSPVFAPIYNWRFIGTIFTLLLAAVSVLIFFLLNQHMFIRHMALSVVLAGIPFEDLSIQILLGKASSGNLFPLLIIAVYTISLTLLAFAPNLVISIKTKGGTPSVEVRRKDSIFSFQHNDYTGFSQVMPGPDTDLAMRELGAVIREVQQTGTYSEKQ